MECSFLHKAASTHIESFNYVIHKGLHCCCIDIDPVWTETQPPVKIYITDAELSPLHHPMDHRKHRRRIYPAEARMRKCTYFSAFKLQLKFESDIESVYAKRNFFVPLMVKSDLCYLNGMDSFDLVLHKEDPNDAGGYFIINGTERIIKQFLVPKQNYAIAVIDNTFKRLREGYTNYGILIRSVKDNHTSKNTYLHYNKDNSVDVRIFYENRAYYLPFMLVMKALLDSCDALIVEQILKMGRNDPFLKHCLMHMLRTLYNFYPKDDGKYNRICTRAEARVVIGRLFSPCVSAPLSPIEITKYLFRKCLLIHLPTNRDKFNFLSFSICKLLSLVRSKFKAEDLNNPVFQEILTAGQSYLIAVKHGVELFLKSVKGVLTKQIKEKSNISLRNIVEKCINRAASLTPVVKMMLATGEILGRDHCLPSNLGYTIPLSRVNVLATASQLAGVYKFTSEFYANSKRKFYPESFGFMCPVYTPEGEHSGLHNCLASECSVVDLNTSSFPTDIIYNFGAIPCNDPLILTLTKQTLIIVDGKCFAWIPCSLVESFIKKMMYARTMNWKRISTTTEIVHLKENHNVGLPGIYIFSAPCRFVRKILMHFSNKSTETYFGMFEQLFPNDLKGCICEEIDNSSFLSISAKLIPFSENNPAPRNMFTCAKSKQAISFPFPNMMYRSDTKIAQLVHPQTPVVFTDAYQKYEMENYPFGTNLIIAVISYSSYDMEDAITLNKSALQRGLMEDVVHKTVVFEFEILAEECNCTVSELCFQVDPMDPDISNYLDPQGLPFVGEPIFPKQPILSLCSKNGKYLIKTFNEKQKAYVEQVRFMGVPVTTEKLPTDSKRVSITYCMKRIPEPGDKFSNFHSQKGVCGFAMHDVDLPFSASGIIPDILFNPHGLSSRMTVGMMLEIMAGKSSLLRGQKCCVEPFELTDDDSAINRFGKFLKDAGFDYYGTEKFYSGTSGNELEADIFCGSAYYFRLHHVVEEKYQVKSINEIDPATRQPINLHSGAIRFGEMERDAIISHGAINLTLDRLLHNSDSCFAIVCSSCEMVFYPLLMSYNIQINKGKRQIIEELENKLSFCNICRNSEFYRIRIPHVLYYLTSELSAMGIKVKLSKSAEYSHDTECLVSDN